MSNPLVTGAYQTVPNTQGAEPAAQFSTAVTIDGTPMRVAALALSAALGLWALRWAGFRFSVGVK